MSKWAVIIFQFSKNFFPKTINWNVAINLKNEIIVEELVFIIL